MSKVVIYSLVDVGKVMAGPGIRGWEIAKALAAEHEVTLLTPNKCDFTHEKLTILTHNIPEAINAIKTADALISYQFSWKLIKLAKLHGTKLILDAYCPVLLECLEIFKDLSFDRRQKMLRYIYEKELHSFEVADGFICSSEKQCDLIFGMLISLHRLPYLHERNPSSTSFIRVVPFGLTSMTCPPKSGPGPREMFNLSPDDKILHWGGSICNWFDPLSLIKAVAMLSKKRPEIKLIFMGVKFPGCNDQHLKKAYEAIN